MHHINTRLKKMYALNSTLQYHALSMFGSIFLSPMANALGLSLKMGPGCAATRQKTETMIILQLSLVDAQTRIRERPLTLPQVQ